MSNWEHGVKLQSSALIARSRKLGIKIANHLIALTLKPYQILARYYFHTFKKSDELLIDKLMTNLKILESITDKELNSWTHETASLLRKTILEKLSKEDISFVLAGAIAHCKTGKTPLRSYDSFVKAYENTNGVAQEVAHKVFFTHQNKEEENIFLESNPLSFGFLREAEAIQINNLLQKEGYATLPFRLPEHIVQDLTQECRTFNFKKRNAKNCESKIFCPESFDASGVWDCTEDLVRCSNFRKIANSDMIKKPIENYLQSQVSIQEMSIWYTFPDLQPKDESAQLFHYDLDSIRWIKAFIYINDVSNENGPHEYVKGTHKPGAKPTQLLARGYSRVEDSEIEKLVPDSRQIIIGDAGTIILGDTRCFHKGNNPTEGYRLVFEILYAPTSLCYNKV